MGVASISLDRIGREDSVGRKKVPTTLAPSVANPTSHKWLNALHRPNSRYSSQALRYHVEHYPCQGQFPCQ